MGTRVESNNDLFMITSMFYIIILIFQLGKFVLYAFHILQPGIY